MGNEFRVNSYAANWQDEPSILALRNGGFVVTWSSYFNNYDDGPVTTYLAAQFYDADGDRVGGERVLRALSDGHSGSPHMAQLRDGSLVLTWAESRSDAILTNDEMVMAQKLSASGAAQGAAFRVDTVNSTDSVAPKVVATGNGGFVISYGAERSGGTFDDVFHRAYRANGTALGPDRMLDVRSNDLDELVTKSAALDNGRSVIVWNSEAAINDGTDDGQNQIRATILDASGGVVRSDFGLTPHFGGAGGFWSDNENYGYAVAAGAGGGFALANLNWNFDSDDDGNMGIFFSRYDSAGRQVVREHMAFGEASVPGDVEMARLDTGDYVIVWGQDSLVRREIGDDVYGMIVSADGRRIGGVFDIGGDNSIYDDQGAISVAALVGGGFAVAYQSEAIDIEDDGIAGRVYGRGSGGDDRLRVDASGVLAGLGGDDALFGNALRNRIEGGAGGDRVEAGGAADTLSGGSGNDLLLGGSGHDRLAGAGGRDRLDGEGGRNLLTGGAGEDSFVFSTRDWNAEADRITDFSNRAGDDDRILLSSTAFGALDQGALARAAFTIGGGARDAGDRIIYEKASGDLYYDANGTAAGATFLIAHLEAGLDLGADDFRVI